VSESGSSWGELRGLFERAVAATPEERERQLAELERLAPARARELHELLRADGLTGSPLDTSAAPLFASLADAAPAGERAARSHPLSGTRLGPWRLGEVLGQGGMGTVFAAERDDGAFRQSVAVKVLRRAVDDAEQRARFRRERQLLAGLEHPGIVRLLDGGVTADGIPWFALERVSGAPITVYSDERGLGWIDRVKLVLDACDAVEAAHRRLIVHRDLKPSNILVTAEGKVKLLDFGIAKALEPGEAEEAATRAGERPLTPRYAAPEQILGEPTTVAVDVYALGVLLYELLTGSVPHRRGTGSAAELAREIPRETVVPPSRRTPAKRRDPGPLGRGSAAVDLDAIVLTALRPEPRERYGSVAALALELRRLLDGRPVEARGPARGYLVRRFVGRHRLAVGGAALLLLALGFGLAGTLWQAARARAERDRARHEAAKASETARFLVSLFQGADPARSRGDRLTVRELLDRGAARVDAELATQPALQAAMLTLIGAVYRDLGVLDPARSALERAAELGATAAGAESLERAAALSELAALERLAGRLAAARAAGERALTIRELRLGADDLETARTLAILALVDRLEGEPAAGRRKLERALAIAGRGGIESAETGRWTNHLGLLAQDQGHFAEAEALFRKALAMIERSEGAESPLVAQALDNLGMALRAQEKRAEALPVLERALAIVEKSWGTDHHQYGTALNSLGALLLDLGRHQEALRRYAAAAAVYRASLGEENLYLPWPLTGEGLALLELGRPREALARFGEALALRQKLLGERHAVVAGSHSDVGLALAAAGDLAAAEVALRRGLGLARETLEPSSTALAEQIVYLADCLVKRGAGAEAEPLYAEALAIFHAGFPAGHSSIVHCEAALARLRAARPAR